MPGTTMTLWCSTMTLWCKNTMTLWRSTMKLWCSTMTLWSSTMTLWCSTVTLWCSTMTLWCSKRPGDIFPWLQDFQVETLRSQRFVTLFPVCQRRIWTSQVTLSNVSSSNIYTSYHIYQKDISYIYHIDIVSISAFKYRYRWSLFREDIPWL